MTEVNVLPESLVCSICLQSDSDPNKLNEIVVCDLCGISVHEVCYGIIDDEESNQIQNLSNSGKSDINSNPEKFSNYQDDDRSIEYWFCDECKVSQKPRFVFNDHHHCELCPNIGYGPKKETETNDWIHMVCALYTPSVQFHVSSTLSGITLAKLDSNHWGLMPCNFCKDKESKFTGYTICCQEPDCKLYFHATCSQRQGLIFSSLDSKNPYYILCPKHAQIQNLQSIVNCNLLQVKLLDQTFNDESIKQRLLLIMQDNPGLLIELKRHSENYYKLKSKWPEPWIKRIFFHRPITSNGEYAKLFARKSNSMMFNCDLSPNDSKYCLDIENKSKQLLHSNIKDSIISNYIQTIYDQFVTLDKQILNKKTSLNKINQQRNECIKKLRQTKANKQNLINHIKKAIQNAIDQGYLDNEAQTLSLENIAPFDDHNKAKCQICLHDSYMKLMTKCHCESKIHFFHISCLKQQGIQRENIRCPS